MKIGIIIGSIREGSVGPGFADWILERAKDSGTLEFEILDLASFNVPLLTSATIPGAANKQYDNAEVTAWSQAVDACDGFIFVTPEYNHGVPGALKNAFDVLGGEWQGKPVAFASYGAEAGVRAVEQWRQIVSNFSMVDIRQQLSVSRFMEFDAEGRFTPTERREGELKLMLDQLVPMTEKLGA